MTGGVPVHPHQPDALVIAQRVATDAEQLRRLGDGQRTLAGGTGEEVVQIGERVSGGEVLAGVDQSP